LIHGSGLTHIVWSLHEQFLASKGYSVLALDLPAHGNSEGPAIKSIEETADWINKLMQSLKIKEISLVGHSQGCLIGLEFAHRFPKLIKSLTLVGGSYSLPVNQDLIDYADGGDMKSVELMMKWGYEGVKKFIGGNPVQKIINSPRQVQEGLAVDLRACNNYKNGSKASNTVSCPTLCVLGDKDKMVPLEKGKKMAAKIKNSELSVIKECGHMILFEKAFEMREIVKKFIEKNHK
jgi:pimeloyl-ACP methyl ester carboxylesterase